METWDEKLLAEHDGREGKSVCLVYRNRVYDVSKSKHWQHGFHMNRHRAGQDLSDDLSAAPHGEEVLTRFPQVALYREKSKEPLPECLSRMLNRFPILRRHPHPALVHFPIVFFLSLFVFDLLYLATGQHSFHETSLLCLYAGLLTMPTAMMTGFFTWWINYKSRAMKAVARKIQLSSLTLMLATGLLFWRTQVPDLLQPFRIESLLYLSGILLFWPLLIAIGFLGGALVFPVGARKAP